MSPDERIRFAPATFAIDVIAVSRVAGIPCFSIILHSVAPQRVPVPQVLVAITA